jgi:hypothetical protein
MVNLEKLFVSKRGECKDVVSTISEGGGGIYRIQTILGTPANSEPGAWGQVEGSTSHIGNDSSQPV